MAEEEIRDPGTVTFNDVAVYFSLREWELLADWQKKLYSNVMKEIHGALTALGYEIANPGILVRVQQSEDPIYSSGETCKEEVYADAWRSRSDVEEEHMDDPVPSLPPVKPDILLRVKMENVKSEQSCQTSAPKMDSEQEDSSSVVFNPDLALWIKQEEGAAPADSRCPLKDDDDALPPLEDVTPDGHRVDQPLPKVVVEDLLRYFDEEKEKVARLRGAMPDIALQPVLTPKEITSGVPGDCDLPAVDGGIQGNLSSSVEGVRKYKCTFCEKTFLRNTHMQEHERMHTGERPYQCQKCPKRFKRFNHLKEHQHTHTGERPYKCKECGKTFTHSASLLHHRRTHTGEKPHKCPICPKSFSQNSDLIRHQHTHRDKAHHHHCGRCGQSFKSKSQLRVHSRVHVVGDILQGVEENAVIGDAP